MKKFLILFILILFAVSHFQAKIDQPRLDKSSIFGYGQPESVGLSKETLKQFSKKITTWTEAGEVIGAEFMIIKGKKIILHQVFGWRNREKKIPMTKNTIFRIRSMTKPFVGMAVLMLMEQGKLKLEDKAGLYLKSYNKKKSKDITIRQLITMTAGFKQDGYPKQLTFCKNLREAVDAVAVKGPPLPPGKQWTYSDKCSATLASIVARITGVPAEVFIQNRILTPLGLDSTFCNLKEQDPRRKRVSCTYRKSGNVYFKYWDSSQPQLLKFFRGSGGIYSSPRDYAKFLLLWRQKGVLRGERFMKTRTIDMALEPTSLYEHYAMHWKIFNKGTNNQLPVFGHSGSDGTMAMMIPHKELIILYFTQSRGGPTISRMRSLIKKIFIDKK